MFENILWRIQKENMGPVLAVIVFPFHFETGIFKGILQTVVLLKIPSKKIKLYNHRMIEVLGIWIINFLTLVLLFSFFPSMLENKKIRKLPGRKKNIRLKNSFSNIITPTQWDRRNTTKISWEMWKKTRNTVGPHYPRGFHSIRIPKFMGIETCRFEPLHPLKITGTGLQL